MSPFEELERLRSGTRKIVQHLGYLDNQFSHIGSISQCHALQKLEKGPLTIMQLSQELSLDHSTASRLAKSLVLKRLCNYVRNSQDNRTRSLSLTEEGSQKLKEIHKFAVSQVSDALKQLSKSQIKIVIQGISLYAEALETTIQKRTSKA